MCLKVKRSHLLSIYKSVLDSLWFFIFHHFPEGQRLEDATDQQDAASYPGYEQCRAKRVSGNEQDVGPA